MCNCASKKSSSANFNNRQATNPNQVVTTRFYKPGQSEPIKLFNGKTYLGKVAHGGLVNVPSSIVGIEREDGSRFLIPDVFARVEMPIIPLDTPFKVLEVLAQKELL